MPTNQLSFVFTATAAFEEARAAARACRACPLWEPATQTVFGEGPVPAPVMLIGEQPGDKEDLAGKPFVGPAGGRLNEALEEAGIPRAAVYITNAVKHFKYAPRGKIRLHQKPVTAEIKACRQWLERELDFVQPRVAVALGATAAQSLFGKAMPVNRNRGQLFALGEAKGLITIHPSYLLRIEDPADAAAEYKRFVADLSLLKPYVKEWTAGPAKPKRAIRQQRVERGDGLRLRGQPFIPSTGIAEAKFSKPTGAISFS